MSRDLVNRKIKNQIFKTKKTDEPKMIVSQNGSLKRNHNDNERN